MSFGRAEAENFLKIVYSEPIVNQIVTHSDCLDLFNQNSDVEHTKQGLKINVAHHYKDVQGVGARGERDYIPQATSPDAVSQEIFLKYLYFTIQLTQQAMTDMQRGEAAFLSWAQSTVERATEQLMNDVDRQIIGIGTGALARVDGTLTPDHDADTGLKLKDAFGLAGVNNPADNFQLGMRVVFSDTVGGASLRQNALRYAEVKSINYDTKVVKFTNQNGNRHPSNVAANDYIFRGDAAGSTAKGSFERQKEIMGMLGHFDDGTNVAEYFDLMRSNEEYQFLKARRVDASGDAAGALTALRVMQETHRIRKYAMGRPSVMVGSFGVWRNMYERAKTDREFSNPESYATGAKELSIMVGPLTYRLRIGTRVPEGHLFVIDPGTLERGQTEAVQWDDKTGSMWRQVTDATGTKDEFYGYGKWFTETFCNAPWKNVTIHGLTEAGF